MRSKDTGIDVAKKKKKFTDAKTPRNGKPEAEYSVKREKSKTKKKKVKLTPPSSLEEHCLEDPTLEFENQNLPELYPELSDSLELNPAEQEKLAELSAKEFECRDSDMEYSNSQEDIQCVPGTIDEAANEPQKKKPRFKITPTRQELKEKKENKLESKLQKTVLTPEDDSEFQEGETSVSSDLVDSRNNSQTSNDGTKPKRKSRTPKKVKKKTETEMSKKELPNKSGDERKVGSWAQCGRQECGKWRFLKDKVDPNNIPDRWVCSMNKDSEYADCDRSQEQYDSQDSEIDIVYSPYPPGAIVWAKIAGYPWWPAMMQDDPDYGYYYEKEENSRNPISYHVVFFGKDVSRAWISNICVRNFTGVEEPEDMGQVTIRKKNYRRELEHANCEARNALTLPLEERLKSYGFEKRYKGRIGTVQEPRVEDEDGEATELDSGTSQELMSSSENSYGSQQDDKMLKKAKPSTATKNKPVGRPKLSKTSDKVQEKSTPRKKKALLGEKDDATSVVKKKKKKMETDKAKMKKSSPGNTDNSCEENTGKDEVEMPENDCQANMERATSDAEEKEDTTELKVQNLPAKESKQQKEVKERKETPGTKDLATKSSSPDKLVSTPATTPPADEGKEGENTADQVTNPSAPSTDSRKGKSKAKKRCSGEEEASEVTEKKEIKKRKTPTKTPTKTNTTKKSVKKKPNNSQDQENSFDAAGLAESLEDKNQNESSVSKLSATESNKAQKPGKSMPKLIKPSFKPPPKTNSQNAAKKMPKLVKSRFVSPTVNTPSESKQTEVSTTDKHGHKTKTNTGKPTVQSLGGQEGTEKSASSQCKRKRTESDDEGSQIVLKKPKKKTRKVVESDEENEQRIENQDDMESEIVELVEKVNKEQGDSDSGSDVIVGISEEKFMSFMPDDDFVKVQLVSDESPPRGETAAEREVNLEDSPEF